MSVVGNSESTLIDFSSSVEATAINPLISWVKMTNSESNYLVPWINKAEWFEVREKLTSEKVEDVIEAYEILAVWKARIDALPAFVECTYGLLKVMVQDHTLKVSDLNEFDTRLTYSTEIIRFVNHVHSVTKVKGSSLYNSAKINNIPDWIVSLRHESSHGQTLPSLDTLHLAAKVCLTWLLKNYWFLKEKFTSKLDQALKLYSDEFLTKNINVRLYALYRKTIRLWETCCEISNDCLISDLPNEHLYYISNLVRLYKSHEYTSKNGDYCDMILKRLNTYCVNSNEHRLKDLKRSVIELMKYITSNERQRNTFVYTISQADFLFDFMHVEWKEVIFFIQIVKCFDLFVKHLFELVAEENLVALSVLEALASSIEILRRQWPKYKEKFKRRSLDKKEKMRLKKKYCKSYRHVKFPLKLQKPPVITLDMLEDVFKCPSVYTKDLICKYLPLVEPPLPKDTIEGISRLLEIYCDTDKTFRTYGRISQERDKIFTLDDLKMHFARKDEPPGRDRERIMPRVVSQLWMKSTQSSDDWSSSPIGMLPHQNKAELTIPKHYTYQEEEDHIKNQLLPPLTMSTYEMSELLDFDLTYD